MSKINKILIRFFLFLVVLSISLIIYSSFNPLEKDGLVRLTNNSTYNPDNSSITNERSNFSTYTKVDKSFLNFIRKWQLAGASIAIAKDGKLLYAKGFGYANKEEKIPIEPYNIFRIASVSKLITATAIMKLEEDGMLSLDAKIFGVEGILNDPQFLNYKDKRVEDITVKYLLNHSGGWSSRWGDHMFINDVIAKSLNKPLPITLEDIVVFALSKKLHFKPGNHSSYSNLGYSILQLVIEKVTDESYEDYVKENIFKPIGIKDAHIAHNYDHQRFEKEVRYYEVPEAEMIKCFDGKDSLVYKSRGGNDITTLGAAGGWVISSIDLIKFLLSIDTNTNTQDILSENSILQMVEHEGHFHPFGWRWVMANGKWWRSGSFAGSSALAVVQNDGFTYVFITNSSPWSGARFPYQVDRLMNKVIASVKSWPEINLFIDEQNYNNSPFNNFQSYVPFFAGKFTPTNACLPPID